MPTAYLYMLRFKDETDDFHNAARNAVVAVAAERFADLPHRYAIDRHGEASPKKFRRRSRGMRVHHSLCRGDVVIVPSFRRAFFDVRDLAACVKDWKIRGARLVCLSPEFDTDEPSTMKAIEISTTVREQILTTRVAERGPRKEPANRIKHILGIRIAEVGGKAKRKRMYVHEEVYEIGLMLQKWKSEGRSLGEMERHLFDSKVQRPARSLASRVNIRTGMSGKWWDQPALKKVLANMPIIEAMVIAKKARMARHWMPPSGPLIEYARVVPAEEMPEGFVHPPSRSTALDAGAKIRAARLAKKWSQIKLGKVTGIKQSHISALECGHHVGNQKTIEKIAEALKVDFAQLA